MKYLFKTLLRKLGYKIVQYESLPYNKRMLETYEVFKDLTLILEENSVNGVFVECGYGFGRSFAIFSHFAAKERRKIYGIDSFIGFPNVSEIDYSIRNPRNGEWSVRSLSEAKKCIKNLGIFENNDEFKLFQLILDKNTKNPIPNEKIAFLHVDLDLYIGYKYALEMFWDQIQVGGVVLFDEYDQVQWPGATAAINEFLENKDISRDQVYELGRKHYIVKD